MQTASLFAVPLPFVTALLASVVALRLMADSAASAAGRALFAVLFAVFALEAVLVGLRFGYGIDLFIPLQRALPLLVGPLLLLGFQAQIVERYRLMRRVACHLGIAGLAAGAVAGSSRLTVLADVFIVTSYVTYLTLLVRIALRGEDVFEHARLGGTVSLYRWLAGSIGLLAFILVLDTAIALDFTLHQGRHARALIALGSLPLIAAFVAVALLLRQGGARRDRCASAVLDPPAEALVQRAATYFEQTEIYRDPDITLSRLARRLGVPSRTLSSAINEVRGINVSQFVNEFRLREAADRLQTSAASVAEVMTESGFLTRSNFYREFKRVYGVSPAVYRERYR